MMRERQLSLLGRGTAGLVLLAAFAACVNPQPLPPGEGNATDPGDDAGSFRHDSGQKGDDDSPSTASDGSSGGNDAGIPRDGGNADAGDSDAEGDDAGNSDAGDGRGDADAG